MSEFIIQSNEAGILRVQINRPEKKNALTPPMYTALADAFTKANQDSTVKVIYLTGTQTTFTAGNDLSDFASNNATMNQDSPVIKFLTALATLEKPLVVAANGPAVGIGTTLMLHSDFVILGEETRLKMPFVSLGLCPEAASSYLLPLRVGFAKTAEWLILGKTFSAHEAKEAGLVNEICSMESYQNRALEIAQEITTLPTTAVAATRKLIKSHIQQVTLDTIKAENLLFSERLQSPEAREAFTAFFQKRAPDFRQFDNIEEG